MSYMHRIKKVREYFSIQVKQDLSLPIISALTIHNEKRGIYKKTVAS